MLTTDNFNVKFGLIFASAKASKRQCEGNSVGTFTNGLAAVGAGQSCER